jgi:hypothetical protein
MVISVNSQDVFINDFMNWPRDKTYPKRESELLLSQMLPFAHFASYMHLCTLRAANASSTTVDDMLDLLVHSGFDIGLKAKYQQYLSELGGHSIDSAKVESVSRASRAIVGINKRYYRRQETNITFFLENFWDRIAVLVYEFFKA